MLNLTIDLSKLTALQLAHLYLVVVKMGRMQDADMIYKSLCVNCGDAEADRIIGLSIRSRANDTPDNRRRLTRRHPQGPVRRPPCQAASAVVSRTC